MASRYSPTATPMGLRSTQTTPTMVECTTVALAGRAGVVRAFDAFRVLARLLELRASDNENGGQA